jgi:lipopolysaccharide transport system permease protein
MKIFRKKNFEQQSRAKFKKNHYKKISIYTPDSSLIHPQNMITDMFRALLDSRGLAWQLTLRDIRAQYRQTALGLLWAFILPLAHTLTWIFLNNTGIVSVNKTDLPYPIYVFTGTMLWAIFMDAVNAPLQQTLSAKHMLAKINFPKEALVLSGIFKTLFNGFIKIFLLIISLTLLGIYPGWGLLYFPIGIISLILTGTAIGLLITPIGVLYTDVGKALPLLLQFLMYMTPVVFPMPAEGFAKILFTLNPLTPVMLNTRNWLTGFASEFMGYFVFVNFFVIFLLLIVWIVYRVAMPILIERMSA